MRAHRRPAGARITYADDAVVHHWFAPSLHDGIRRSRAYGRGNARRFLKHRDTRLIVYPTPVLVAGTAVVWVTPATTARAGPRRPGPAAGVPTLAPRDPPGQAMGATPLSVSASGAGDRRNARRAGRAACRLRARAQPAAQRRWSAMTQQRRSATRSQNTRPPSRRHTARETPGRRAAGLLTPVGGEREPSPGTEAGRVAETAVHRPPSS